MLNPNPPQSIGLMRLLLLFACVSAAIAQPTFQPTDGGIFLGSFRTRAHRVAGDVFLLTERIMEIRDYSYDGTAPVVYFWVSASITMHWDVCVIREVARIES